MMSLSNWSLSERKLRNSFNIKNKNPVFKFRIKPEGAGGVLLRYLNMEDMVSFMWI